MHRKQVDKKHYSFGSYVTKNRWASIWHQIHEVLKFNPTSVLEIGPGPGLFKAACSRFEVAVETLDLDPDLNPDHIASVLDLPFESDHFDVVCAYQMLEHLPFQESLMAFKEMSRVARNGVVISLPDAQPLYHLSSGPHDSTDKFLIFPSISQTYYS